MESFGNRRRIYVPITIAISLIAILVPLIWPSLYVDINYHVHRFVKIVSNGTNLKIADHCYQLPERWYIESISEYREKQVYKVFSKLNDELVSVVAYQQDSLIPPKDRSLKRLEEHQFSIYEMLALSQDVEFRYWSHFKDSSLVVIGASVGLVEQFSRAVRKTRCQG